MDRASILGDAIEYLKELLQRINDLHNELESTPPGSSLTPTTSFHPLTPTPPTLPSRIKDELCPSSLPSPNGQAARVKASLCDCKFITFLFVPTPNGEYMVHAFFSSALWISLFGSNADGMSSLRSLSIMAHIKTFSDTVLVLLYTQVEVRVREGRAVNIHMFCGRRPGLLLSAMRALDNLGLDIQQAVISCFNGFAMDIFRAEVEPLSVINSLASI